MDESQLSIGNGPLGGLGTPKVNPSLLGASFTLPSAAPTPTNPYESFAGQGTPSSPISAAGGNSALAGTNGNATNGMTAASDGNLYPSYLSDFYNSLKTKPTSPVSQNGTPLSYGSNAAPSTSSTTTQTNTDGSSNIVDAHGNNLSGNNFSVGGTGGTGTGGTDVSYTPSTDLNGTTSSADVNSALALHQKYVQQLAAAEGYSPAYLSAYQASQSAQANDAMLANQINSPYGPGQTLGQLQDTISYARTGNAAQQASANIALNTQQLARQGDIAAATALVGATAPQSVSPGSSLVSPYSGQSVYGGAGAYSDYQAQQTYFNLQQNFPDAKIPAYDPTQSAQQNLQVAQNAAQQAPSFQSRNITPVYMPGGGINFVNKNQIVTNQSNGQSVIVSPQDATTINAASGAVKDLTTQQANTQRAIDTAESNFPLFLNLVKDGGINKFDSPIANELANKFTGTLSSRLAPFKALTASLQMEYSQILSRGGSVTDTVRNEANQIVDNSISYNGLVSLYNTLKAESTNVLKGYSDGITNYNKQISDIANKGQPLSAQPQGGATSGTTATSWGSI